MAIRMMRSFGVLRPGQSTLVLCADDEPRWIPGLVVATDQSDPFCWPGHAAIATGEHAARPAIAQALGDALLGAWGG